MEIYKGKTQMEIYKGKNGILKKDYSLSVNNNIVGVGGKSKYIITLSDGAFFGTIGNIKVDNQNIKAGNIIINNGNLEIELSGFLAGNSQIKLVGFKDKAGNFIEADFLSFTIIDNITSTISVNSNSVGNGVTYTCIITLSGNRKFGTIGTIISSNNSNITLGSPTINSNGQILLPITGSTPTGNTELTLSDFRTDDGIELNITNSININIYSTISGNNNTVQIGYSAKYIITLSGGAKFGTIGNVASSNSNISLGNPTVNSNGQIEINITGANLGNTELTLNGFKTNDGIELNINNKLNLSCIQKYVWSDRLVSFFNFTNGIEYNGIINATYGNNRLDTPQGNTSGSGIAPGGIFGNYLYCTNSGSYGGFNFYGGNIFGAGGSTSIIWHNSGSSASSTRVFFGGNNSNYLVRNNGTLSLCYGGTTVNGSVGLGNNTWNMIAVIYDGYTAKVYVNNTLIITRAGISANSNGIGILRSVNSNPSGVTGQLISGFSYYSRPLAEDELSYLHNNGNGKNYLT